MGQGDYAPPLPSSGCATLTSRHHSPGKACLCSPTPPASPKPSQGFFHVCKLVKRLDRSEGDFLKEVAENEAVRFYVHSIRGHGLAIAAECGDFKAPFHAYADLWTVDIAEALGSFLTDNAVAPERSEEVAADGEGGAAAGAPLATAEDEASDDDGLVSARPEPPLYMFDEKIVFYKNVSEKIGALPTIGSKGFLKVDAKPVKQVIVPLPPTQLSPSLLSSALSSALSSLSSPFSPLLSHPSSLISPSQLSRSAQALSTWVTKWMFAYTQHLQSSVQDTLRELASFMDAVNAGLENEVSADDVPSLVQVLVPPHPTPPRLRPVVLPSPLPAPCSPSLVAALALLTPYVFSAAGDDVHPRRARPHRDGRRALRAAARQGGPAQEVPASALRRRHRGATRTHDCPPMHEWPRSIPLHTAQCPRLNAHIPMHTAQCPRPKPTAQCTRPNAHGRPMPTAARLPQVLDHAPFKWEDTKKASLNARERLGPLQALQAEKIKEDAEDFGIRVADFRKARLALCPSAAASCALVCCPLPIGTAAAASCCSHPPTPLPPTPNRTSSSARRSRTTRTTRATTRSTSGTARSPRSRRRRPRCRSARSSST